jgi:hypothetical protein
VWEGIRDPAPLSPPLGETYIRLADVDLDEPTKILAFVNTYDKLNVFEACLPHAPSFDIPWSRAERQAVDEARKEFGEVMFREDPKGFSSAREWAENDFDSESVFGFVMAARTLRDGLRAWQLLRGDIDYDDVEWETDEYRQRDDHQALSRRELRTRYQLTALDALVIIFDSALRPFHPGISIDHTRLGTRGEAEITLVPSHERQGLDLYSICALELYRHVAENANYSVCENETCGQLFVRQIGRAKYGQHRTRGVFYCRPSCARAQAQRAYRRRRESRS